MKYYAAMMQHFDAVIFECDAAHWRRWQAYWGRYVGGEGS